jgi:uncharacterized repeat protein (TIGR03803 family)
MKNANEARIPRWKGVKKSKRLLAALFSEQVKIMKTAMQKSVLRVALMAVLGLLLVGRVAAQTFTTLYSFTATDQNGCNSDGVSPYAGLTLSGDTLYGTATAGGSSGNGAVFALNTNGTGFTNLHSFTGGSDGAAPQAGLIMSGNTLYGTAAYGGRNGAGTVFSVLTNGTNFTALYTFTGGNDGGGPYAGLILSGNTLYGTASEGGSAGYGTVFSITTNGTHFTTLYSFTNGTDGADPVAGVILSGTTLYGTAILGGSNGNGTVFAVNIDGTDFTTLYSFTAFSSQVPYFDFTVGANSDGAAPYGGVVLSGNTLYGTARGGGVFGHGSVFAVNTNGTGFTNLYNFTAIPGYSSPTNSSGANPVAGLTLSGNTLYGTAETGGSLGWGTVFGVNTDGSSFTTIYNFTDGSDQGNPQAGLVLSGSTLYGTTSGTAVIGGMGNGTVFALSAPPPPSLEIASAGNQVVLYWPSSVYNYVLQATTNLSTSNWVTVSNGVPIIGVTLCNTSPGAFFRLQQQ